MSQPDDYDFLGWAPDPGSWESPPVQHASAPPPRPVVAAPTPPPAHQTVPRRSGVAGNPPKPPATRPPTRPGRLPASKLRVPALVAAAVMLVFTFFTALMLATGGPRSSPVMLGVFGVLTVLLGRVAWGLRHR
ncbi:MAG TPA: hypothetical protein VFW55_06120 [Propionicimonas sp.]|nr:hypothetical protein [Propionicimonas sp.]